MTLVKKKIATIVGARPQFIKIGPVSRVLAENGATKEFIIHTGQHFDDNMSEIFFRELNLPTPDENLGIGGGSHGEQTAQMLVAVESILIRECPDLVLVYGDTNSTLAGALAAAKLNIPIAHVEAGLRSFNRKMPEEINRILTDQLSTLLFTPSQTADEHLSREGIDPASIFQVGDVMHDSVLNNIQKARRITRAAPTGDLTLGPQSYILLTLHRAENTDNATRLNFLVDEIVAVGASHCIVFPLHPRTRQALARIGRLEDLAMNVRIVEPQGYLGTLSLLENARLLMTDSGGMQKEAMFLKTPCLTLRGETEWVETVRAKVNCLYELNAGPLLALVESQVDRRHDFNSHPYGEGDAARKICAHLETFLRSGESQLST